ncbi:deoxyuridine triphosphatase [Anaeramoeba flamelloides]|uniref:Deoxyuridine 5'-triphosphate nucleotidohydrolase n=1 Tax=Anaeramoeba flamelloides TaxID=1746091 RepID=A0ABQ8YFQ5_9EUKA|nr:deoxyuridine triphosphatase [Anaeramoeba flamelloides]
MSEKTLEQQFFQDLSTETRSYLYGLICGRGKVVSKGTLEFTIPLGDSNIIQLVEKEFEDKIDYQVKIFNSSLKFSVRAESNLSLDFNLDNYNKSSEQLAISGIRALFDYFAFIEYEGNCLCCIFAFTNENALQTIRKQISFPSEKTNRGLEFKKQNAYDLLSLLYSKSTIHNNRIYPKWIQLASYGTLMQSNGFNNNNPKQLEFKWRSSDKNAVPPYKPRASDSGYDLTIIKIKKIVNNVIFCDTGVQIEPPFGYYFDLVPRSSISRMGYILANSVGIIDAAYRGNILIPLIKIDENAQELTFPIRVAQLIPRRIVDMKVVKCDELLETERGNKGFGSSGKK